MPSVSGAQHRFMAAAMNDPAFARSRGIAPRVAAEFVHADRGNPAARGIARVAHRDAGGIVPGNPMVAAQMRQYQDLPLEKLQELAVRLGASPQGQLVRRALMQRQMAPQNDAPLATSQAAPSGPMRRGGIVHRAGGGGSPMGVPMSMASPWWERSEAHGMGSTSGLLHSPVAGRTDHLPVAAPSGSYVVPADVVSGIGEGNTLAGARIMQEALATGPWGTPLPHGGGGHGMPRPPHMAMQARGGPTGHVPIMAAGGEFIIHRNDVARIGGGNLPRGHAILDRWVVKQRRRVAHTMLKLPGPKKS